MNSKTAQTVTLTRIQWASLLINLHRLRQTTIIEYLTNEISEQVGLPIAAEEDGIACIDEAGIQLLSEVSVDNFYN